MGRQAHVRNVRNAWAPAARVPGLPRRLTRRMHRHYVHGRIAAQRLKRPGRLSGDWNGVRILMYHRVANAPGDPLAIPPERFRRQIDVLRADGLPILSVRDVYDILEGGAVERGVAITLDDGYLDSLTAAEPILREFEAPATVFVPTGIISRDVPCTWYRDPPPFLNWTDVKTLVAGGLVDVQPHGVAHLALPALPDDAAHKEIEGSVSELRERAQIDAHTYSYAAGRYGPREVSAIERSTLRGAVTCDPGVNTPGIRHATLRRTGIFGHESVGEFRAVLAGALDEVSLARRFRGTVNALRGR
jgi:peptidoglycan/xylan/chitin deacetylase (PgdA/CDA1 family)